MKESELKEKLAISIIIAYFFILLSVVILWMCKGFTEEEMTTTLAILLPTFAAYFTYGYNFIDENKQNSEDNNTQEIYLKTSYKYMVFSIPLIYVVFLFILLLLKSFAFVFESFEQFKLLLGVTESIFGIIVAKLISSLFEKK